MQIRLAIFLSICLALTACASTRDKINSSLQDTGRSMEIMGDDLDIKQHLDKIYSNNPTFKDSHLVVTSLNHVVLLVGQTPSEAIRQKAAYYAAHTKKVKRVYNEITITGPTSALTRSSDAWITTKVKTDLVAKLGLGAGKVKVVTENGTVYLLGTVTHQQAKDATLLARKISGVQRVVKLFEYTDYLN